MSRTTSGQTPTWRHVVAGIAGATLLAGCGLDAGGAVKSAQPTPTPSSTSATTPPDTGAPTAPPTGDELDVARSQPVEDSVYPQAGDPSVDALHYDLDLTWEPQTDTLTGKETITFRSTGTAEEFQLDLGDPLQVGTVTLDGEKVESQHRGKNLVVQAPVEKDRRYRLTLDYTGTPRPVEAPTTRSDIPALGFTIDADHEVWTMQEPYGAYTWYAVNDQPADKALYDFTLHVPSPWTGIANGKQTSMVREDGTTTTTYHLAEPASSYLVTLAFGAYQKTEDTGPGGLPITYWTPREEDRWIPRLQVSPEAIAWLEQYLGDYPYATAGVVVVDSESGMETQTMITLGSTPYSTSAGTIVHEYAHHWWGNQVSPSDWRDVWMNEGMAMYLQLMWDAEQQGVPIDSYMRSYVPFEKQLRRQSGPFGDYDPDEFGTSNIYFGPAMMWHELRERLGDEAFFDVVVRGWPRAQDNQSSDREELLAYLEKQTGEQLDDFYRAWLLGQTSPPVD